MGWVSSVRLTNSQISVELSLGFSVMGSCQCLRLRSMTIGVAVLVAVFVEGDGAGHGGGGLGDAVDGAESFGNGC